MQKERKAVLPSEKRVTPAKKTITLLSTVDHQTRNQVKVRTEGDGKVKVEVVEIIMVIVQCMKSKQRMPQLLQMLTQTMTIICSA